MKYFVLTCFLKCGCLKLQYLLCDTHLISVSSVIVSLMKVLYLHIFHETVIVDSVSTTWVCCVKLMSTLLFKVHLIILGSFSYIIITNICQVYDLLKLHRA